MGMVHTLQPTYFVALGLIPRIQARERRTNQEGDDGPPPVVTLKKVFQFLHKTNTAMVQASAEVALQQWLVGAGCADQVDREAPGSFEPICYEFLTQALLCFEEELSETTKQYQYIFTMVGALASITCLEG